MIIFAVIDGMFMASLESAMFETGDMSTTITLSCADLNIVDRIPDRFDYLRLYADGREYQIEDCFVDGYSYDVGEIAEVTIRSRSIQRI